MIDVAHDVHPIKYESDNTPHIDLVSFAIDAQTFRGGEIFRIGTSDVYWAAVKTLYFKEYVARQEDCWCWAACVQMILLYNYEYVTQSDIASIVFGDSYNRTASYLIDEISAGHPLIIGLGEHAYLLAYLLQESLERTVTFIQGHINKP